MNDFESLITRILAGIIGEMKQKLQDENLSQDEYESLNSRYQEMFDGCMNNLDIHLAITKLQRKDEWND